MIESARVVRTGAVLTPDVCIIGAGAAGITLARDLAESSLDVLVLESGGFDADEGPQDLSDGDVTGLPLRFEGVEQSPRTVRLRQFGGSTMHWSGMCRPLDAIDFEARDDLPSSGWPFGVDELTPYYPRARATCQLGADEWDPSWWFDGRGDRPLLDTPDVRPVLFQFSPPTRFGTAYRAQLDAAPRVRVLLDACVVDLESVPDGSGVRRCSVATLAGNHFDIEPAAVVIATGGLEVPRLLLASNRQRPEGLGNAHDLVGRYFLEHPHVAIGRAVISRAESDLWLSHHGPSGAPGVADAPVWMGLGPTEQVVRERGLRNVALTLEFVPRGEVREDAGRVVGAEATRLLLDTGLGTSIAEVTLRAEAAPDPESRVTLTRSRDALGVPRLSVDWRLSDDDRRSWIAAATIVAAALGREGVGRMEVPPLGHPVWTTPETGNHHMGTARMHVDPTRGVVDADGRVHGIANLYVAGSAVFPTAGFANPTLTVVALAHRLARHLSAG